MTRKTRTMFAAAILAAFAAFFATTAFTEQGSVMSSGAAPSAFGLRGVNATLSQMSERLDFRLERLEIMLTAMQTAFQTAIDAMLELSDDIGEMADRILKMSNRIVLTMKLMSETLLEMQKTMAAMLLALQEGRCDTPTAAMAASTVAMAGVIAKDTLILSPSEGQTLTDTTVFELAGGYDDYILYASSDAGMAKSTNILVQDNDLTGTLARIKANVTGKQIYVAAKAVDGGAVGELSNTVMLYVP